MVDAGLQRVEDASSSQVVLVQAGPGPVIRGEHQAGKDYVCVWCGRRTLIERGVLSGLWDLVIECGACHRRSATPQLPPGMPLGTPLVMLTVGTYDIKEPVIQNVGAVVASQLAMDRYQAETGRWVNESDSPVVLDADLCEGLLTEIEDLFPDLIVALRPSHRRGRASATPPREPHRLLQLMDQVEGSARSLREDNFPQVNIAALVELRMAIGLSKRWRRNPAWDTLVQAIRSPTDYPHTIVTLAVAGALADWGNGVGLQEGEPSKRSADLRLAIGALGRFDIEVKTPLMLQDPHDALSSRQAKKLVRRLLGKAASGSNRQIGSDHPGLLTIGGFNMPSAHLDVLERACAGAFASSHAERRQVAGILLVNLGISIDHFGQNPLGLLVPHQEPNVYGTGQTRLVRNPRYVGSVTIQVQE